MVPMHIAHPSHVLYIVNGQFHEIFKPPFVIQDLQIDFYLFLQK